jgi:hypothetical protein
VAYRPCKIGSSLSSGRDLTAVTGDCERDHTSSLLSPSDGATAWSSKAVTPAQGYL